ncbi:MAG: DUF5005 domain-containing protein [Planctomycetes bacterium]|nr:DUF5005 domain-containing protein [Planctomycetota bacterium]NOG54079.1 DUF4185 domain-containing protein [Planctomycetota bacterium]
MHSRICTLMNCAVVTGSLAVMAAFSGAAQAQGLVAEPAPKWTALFDRTSGWTGADGIYAIPLSGYDVPGGDGAANAKTLIVFSDTFVGEVNEKGERLGGTTLVNNTAALLTGAQPTEDRIRFFVRNDANGKPRALAIPDTPNSNPDDWYWFQDGVSINGTVHVFALRMKTGNGGEFNFAVAGVARLHAPANSSDPLRDMTQEDAPLFFHPEDGRGELIFGTSFMVNTEEAGSPNPDGYVYIYGTQNDAYSKKLLAARVTPDQFTDYTAWRYWDGSAWVEQLENAAPLTGRVSSELSVSPLPSGRFICVFQADALGKEVGVRFGDSPIGPWGPMQRVYPCPESDRDPDIFVYNAKAHPHLSRPGKLLISYNVNTFDFWDHFAFADIYRPRFIWLSIE